MLYHFRWSPGSRHDPKLPPCNLATMSMKRPIEVEIMIEEHRPRGYGIVSHSFLNPTAILSPRLSRQLIR